MPFYKDLNKLPKDLGKKKFDAGKNTVKHTHSTTSGVKVETTLNAAKPLDAVAKGTFKDSFGSLEVGASTKGQFDTTLKLTDIYKGLVAQFKTVCGGKDANFEWSAQADYSQDNVNVSANYGAADGKNALTASAVVDVDDGFFVGVNANVPAMDFKNASGSIAFSLVEKDFSFGVEGNCSGDLSTSIYQEVNAGHQRSIQFNMLASKPFSADFTTQYRLDSATVAKASVSTSGTVKTALEHTLSDMKINLSTEGTGNNFNFKTSKYGLGISLGQF